MLYDVNVSIFVDALTWKQAESKVGVFLREEHNLNYNFLIHNTDPAGEESLSALRKRQENRNET